jgi:hypothetical protein
MPLATSLTTPPLLHGPLQIAKLAMSMFVARSEAVLRQYAHEEAQRQQQQVAGQAAAGLASSAEGGGGEAAEPAPLAPTPLLVDKALHVVQLLQGLYVAPAVSDSMVAWRPQLRPWLEVVRARRRQTLAAMAAAAGATAGGSPMPRAAGASRTAPSGEQTHLLALYEALCEAAGVQEAGVRGPAVQMLLQVGKDVGLLELSTQQPGPQP